MGCGTATFRSTATSPIITPITTPAGANVLPIDVNGGPEVNQPGAEFIRMFPFATAKICAPGSLKLRDDQRSSCGNGRDRTTDIG